MNVSRQEDPIEEVAGRMVCLQYMCQRSYRMKKDGVLRFPEFEELANASGGVTQLTEKKKYGSRNQGSGSWR